MSNFPTPYGGPAYAEHRRPDPGRRGSGWQQCEQKARTRHPGCGSDADLGELHLTFKRPVQAFREDAMLIGVPETRNLVADRANLGAEFGLDCA